MKRRDYIWGLPAIVACLILGVLLCVIWVIMLIPVMLKPSLIPDPRMKVIEVGVKRGMKTMMRGTVGT